VPTTTERGLGWQHQKQRARLLRAHIDGTPCPCDVVECGPACLCRGPAGHLPMYKDADRNPDAKPLEADHSVARSLGGKVADRLMLATCNNSRGNGTRKALVTGTMTKTVTSRAWLAG